MTVQIKRIDSTEKWQAFSLADLYRTAQGLYVLDLITGQMSMLVEGTIGSAPDPMKVVYFSTGLGYFRTQIPNFYNNTVIYIRSNCLWQIDLDGSNNRRLFPPP